MNIEDLGLEGDQLEFVKKLAESAKSNNSQSEKIESLEASIKKLEDNNYNLLNEKKQTLEKLQQEKENSLKGAELETAITERLENKYQEQIEALTNKNSKLTSNVLDSEKDSVVSDILGMFKTPELVKLTLQNMVKTEMTDNGISYEFSDFDGKPFTADAKAFKEWISEQPQLSDNIIATQASGSNAVGSGGAHKVAADIPKTLAECKGDPEAERQYFANQRKSMI